MTHNLFVEVTHDATLVEVDEAGTRHLIWSRRNGD